MSTLMFYFFMGSGGNIADPPPPPTHINRDQFIADFSVVMSFDTDVSILRRLEVGTSIATDMEFAFER